MSDAALDEGRLPRNWASDEARRRVRRRYGADRRLQAYGIIAITLAIGVLVTLLGSILISGLPAFFQTQISLDYYIDPGKVDAQDPAKGNYRAIVRDTLAGLFSAAGTDKQKTDLTKLLTSDAPYIVRDYVVRHPESVGQKLTLSIPASDIFDQIYKGAIPREVDALSWSQVAWFDALRNRNVVVTEDGVAKLKLDVFLDPSRIEKGPPLTGDFADLAKEGLHAYLPTVRDSLLFAMLADDAPDAIKARVEADPSLIGKTVQIELPVSAPFQELAKGETPKVVNPRITTQQLEAFDALVEKGAISMPFNWDLFVNADSRLPERAGLGGAIVGSFLLLLVCFALSFPIGIAAAVYLEEFAPKNRLTDLIEVNINNLAAVPSIVYGLLGLAVFLGFFGLPRSSPLVGGMALSLMTLPTIIIATRAALKAVPPSVREAALGIGASRHQVTMHHVLPLAMPGILTGTIISMAYTIGETAPLLLIGMNAFIPSIDGMGVLEPATTLPTQIYSWADSPERGFVSRTSAAILVLLGVLVVMNMLAIVLRQRFERKW